MADEVRLPGFLADLEAWIRVFVPLYKRLLSLLHSVVLLANFHEELVHADVIDNTPLSIDIGSLL